MSKEDKLNGLLTGVIIGGFIGSAITMLFIPVSGKRMRKKISRPADDLVDEVNEYIDSSRVMAETVIKEGRKKADNIISEAKKILNN